MSLLSLLILAIIAFANIQSSFSGLNIPLTLQKVPTNIHASKIILNRKGRPVSDQVKLRTMDSFYYTSTIEIGQPAQKFTVMFDTGMGLLWVSSAKSCSSNKRYCKKHKTYKSSRSTTYMADGRTYEIKYKSYRSKYIKGFISQDVVKIGKLSVSGQLFAEITDMDEQSRDSQFDGVLGLSFETEGGDEFADVIPVFINMIRSNVVVEPVFAFYFSRVGASESVLTLGEVDSSKYRGKFITTSTIAKDKWLITVNKVTVGKKKVSESLPALIKTGTTAISGPELVIRDIIRVLGAIPSEEDGLYYVDCGDYLKLPTLTFYVENKPLSLSPSDYVVTFDDSERGMACWVGLQGFRELSFLILGDTFMRVFYTKFDVKKKQISFAPAV